MKGNLAKAAGLFNARLAGRPPGGRPSRRSPAKNPPPNPHTNIERKSTMAKLSTDELLDAFKEMTLLELSDFVKKFEEVFEVTAAAPVAVAAARVPPLPAVAPPRPAEEQSEFDVILEAAGDKKIGVIRSSARSSPAWA